MTGRTLVILFLLAAAETASGQFPDPSGPDWRRAEDLFLPAFDYVRHDVNEWLLRVERTYGRDHDALWALYYHDDQSPMVAQALQEIASSSHHEETLLMVQTILNQWGEPYPDRKLRFEPRRPGRVLTSGNAELLDQLDDESVYQRFPAALTLISRQRHVDRAVRALLERLSLWSDQSRELAWARTYSGSAWEEAALDLLADPGVTRFTKETILAQPLQLSPVGAENAVPIITRLGLEHRTLRSRMLFGLCNLAMSGCRLGHRLELWDHWHNDYAYHAHYNREPLASDRLDDLLATHLPRLMDTLLATGDLTEEHLRAVTAVALRGTRVREAIVPRLRELLVRDDALAHRALWLLCHLGQSDEEIRRRYTTHVEELDYISREALEDVPCLEEHDDESLKALEELYCRAPSGPLTFKLAAAELLDTDRSWIARDLVQRHELDVLRWYWLDTCPIRAVWLPKPEDDKTTAATLLGLTIRTKPTEELYDLWADPDEVVNLAESLEHRDVLGELQQAQQNWCRRIRDLGFLPEGEIHARSRGTTPYEMARDDGRYPFERIFAAAELATRPGDGDLAALALHLSDLDSAVRYWGAIGILHRGAGAVLAARGDLVRALEDDSPYVRIAAALALGRHGEAADVRLAVDRLVAMAPWTEDGDVFVSLAALNALDELDGKAAHAVEAIRTLPLQGGASPHSRYNGYVERLIEKTLSDLANVAEGAEGE